MKAFTIGSNDADKRLDRFLFKVMPDAHQSIIYKALRKKHVKVNGKRITDGALRLSRGDVLELYINDEFFSKKEGAPDFAGINPTFTAVYEDEHIIIMDKPAGMLSQGADGDESLEMQMRAYLYKKKEFNPKNENTFIPSLCHRIDRNTRGLVIGAKDSESLRLLNEKIRLREIRKFYLCTTEGLPEPLSGEIKGWLKKDGGTRKMEFYKEEQPGAVFCHTLYRVIKAGESPVIEAELLTGRTHQIRAGFGAMGCPLKGDVKYGAKPDGSRDFQRLTSYKIIFDFKTESGILNYLKGKEISL